MADGSGSAVAGPKKAKSRAGAGSAETEPGFKAKVTAKLDADTTLKDDAKYLVLGALDSDATLTEALTSGEAEIQLKPQDAKQAPPRVAYLKSVTVEGFRGIGKPATLDLPPGPGLTLVIGRNGSGKSSFAEALELLLTGDTFRWKDKRSKVWKEGWRNLHHKTTAIEAEFIVEGEKTPATVKREWPEGTTLESASTVVQVHGKPKTTFDALGWTQPLVSFRPFLSYSELGSMLEEGPSHLYDALASILGLDDLVAAQARLAEARRGREKAFKDANEMRGRILRDLPLLADNRAKVLLDALSRDDWGLDDAESTVSTSDADKGADRDLALLRQLATLPCADAAATETVIRALRDAAQGLKTTTGTLAARSKDLADVLERALGFHTAHGDSPCPVCGKKAALNSEWHEHSAAEVKRLRDTAREATAAQQAADVSMRRAADLPVPRTDVVKQAGSVGIDPGEVLRALDDYQGALKAMEPDDMASAIKTTIGPLRDAVTGLRSKALAEVQRREDRWRPIASMIHAWLPLARDARAAHETIKPLKAAENWLKDTVALLRTEQFEPIKQKCQAIWTQLRQQSNVSLEDIRLAGTATQRKVDLDVTVDGVEGVALGVMSQGELHALALSLFIPRATLAESPFRFIVIDDPVQSMDPARVDGLARVLETAAKDRQVVVFTHDDRLPEAVRRMTIPATVLEVYRREASVVEVVKGRDPVKRHIDDAMAIAYTQNLPEPAAKRVIPGLCRLAIEAACVETVRRKRLGRGEKHSDVEALLGRLSGTRSYVALAIFDDAEKTADVMTRLNKESKDAADLFRILNEGAHGSMESGYRVEIVRRSEKLAQWIQALK